MYGCTVARLSFLVKVGWKVDKKRWEVKTVRWWELKYFAVLYQGKNGEVAVFGQNLLSELGGLRENQCANWFWGVTARNSKK